MNISNKVLTSKILILSFVGILASCGGGGGGSTPAPPADDVTKPNVVSTNPAMNETTLETDIALSEFISVTFNEDVKDNFDTNNFLVHKYLVDQIDTNSILAKEISYSSDNKTVTFKPSKELESKTKYHIVIKNVEDTSGNALGKDIVWEFQTSTPPAVNIISPKKDAIDVNVSPEISFSFSEAIIEESLNSNVLLDGTPITITTAMFENNTLTYKVPTEFTRESLHTITINGGPNGVKDLAGIPIESNTNDGGVNFSWDFTIKPFPALNLQIFPSKNQKYVPVIPEITLAYNRPVNFFSFQSNFSLIEVNTNTNVAVRASYNSNNFTATLVPTAALTLGGDYKIELITTDINFPLTSTFTVAKNGWTNYQPIHVNKSGIPLNDLFYQTQIERGPDNNLTAVWFDNKGVQQSLYNSVTNQWAKTTSPSGLITVLSPNNDTWLEGLRTEIDGAGNMFTTWEIIQQTKTVPPVLSRASWLNRYSNGQWGTPIRLGATANNSTEPSLAVSANGDAYIFWSEYSDTQSGWKYIRYNKATGFEAVKTLSFTINRPKIVLNDAGNGVMVWTDVINVDGNSVGKLYYSDITNGNFTSPVLVTQNNNQRIRKFELVKNKSGKILLVWDDDVSVIANSPDSVSNIKSIEFDAVNSIWSNELIIGTATGKINSFTVVFRAVVNSTGQAAVIWNKTLALSGVGSMMISFYDGNSWLVGSEFLNSNTGLSAISINDIGDVIMVKYSNSFIPFKYSKYTALNKTWSVEEAVFDNFGFGESQPPFDIEFSTTGTPVLIYNGTTIYDSIEYTTIFGSYYK